MKLALGDTDLKLGKVLTAKILHGLHWVGRDMGEEEEETDVGVKKIYLSTPAYPPTCLPACLTVLGVEASGCW